MLSRLAENLYWHGRYLERAEDLARLINVNANLNLDLPSGLSAGWEPLVRITGNAARFKAEEREPSERQVVRFLLSDEANSGSLKATLENARENLRSARDLLPREVWEQMNGLYLKGNEQLTGNLSKRRRHEFLRELILDCQQIAGTLLGCMSQDYAYDFILIGRYLERADMTTRILEVRGYDLLPDDIENLSPYESIQWMSVLKSLTGYQMYRRHVRLRVNGSDVLRFLLRNDQFPRSVMFCLRALEALISGLPGEEDQALRSITRLQRTLNETRLVGLRGEPLGKLMDKLQIELADTHEAVRQTWFPSL
ncbi:MAG: alpha-E domain-containing protein [Wenzhouxiangella sp.]|nr:alpha-E domain-containing protein [Wenzhouxiangella sp.]MCH8478197.1 alpha-E domain-containing protein [Wenzhouxiangella sp.]